MMFFDNSNLLYLSLPYATVLSDSIYIRVADGVETLLNHGYKIGNDILARVVKCTPDTLFRLL